MFVGESCHHESDDEDDTTVTRTYAENDNNNEDAISIPDDRVNYNVSEVLQKKDHKPVDQHAVLDDICQNYSTKQEIG